MAMELDIEVDDAAVLAALNRLAERVRDAGPAMREIAGHLEDVPHQALEDQASPAGDPWAQLKESTQAQREKRGYGAKKPILERRGDLLGGIASRSTATAAYATSGAVYSRVHQFGARKGEFGTATGLGFSLNDRGKAASRGSGRPLPWGDIPARPFMGISAEARAAIIESLERWLGEAG